MEHKVLRQELVCNCGSRESSSVRMEVDTKTGEAELIIEKTFTERYPVTDYTMVMDLHARLNRGGGRRAYSLEDLTK